MIKLFKYKKSASSYIKSETADIGLFTSEETISFLIRPAPKHAASLLGHKSSVWQAGKSLYRHEVSLDSAVRFFGARVRWQAVERGKVVLDSRSEEHTSELQSHHDLVCRLLLEKKK